MIDWSKSGENPDDIPAYPDSAYKNKGWIGWGDWLGNAESFPEISGEHLRPQLITAIKTSPLAVEQVLLSAKIDTIIAHLKTGTLIYTHYVEGMVADYLQESHRALKAGGSLLIAETISRWTDKKLELLDLIASLGFTVVKEQTGNRFLYINATKPLISLI